MESKTKESTGSDFVTMLHYTDKNFEWQKRVDILNSYIQGTEAKLRELAVSSEAQLREAIIGGQISTVLAQITGLKELLAAQIAAGNRAVELFRENLEAWKMVNNEWKDQSKAKEDKFATITGVEKDVQRIEQKVNEIANRFEQLIKPIADYVIAAQGSDKGVKDKSTGINQIWIVVVAVGSFILSIIMAILFVYYKYSGKN